MPSMNALPSLATLSELARVYHVTLRQLLLRWPATAANHFLFASSLESVFRPSRLGELLELCLAEWEDELVYFYGKPFASKLQGNPFRNSLDRAADTGEVERLLAIAMPGWKQEFVLETRPIVVTPLYQIHRMLHREGHGFQLKCIKPKSRLKLDSVLSAMRDLENLLLPLTIVPSIAQARSKLEELRLKAQREADLSLERRALLRLKNRPGIMEVYTQVDHRDILMTWDRERQPVDDIRRIRQSDLVEGAFRKASRPVPLTMKEPDPLRKIHGIPPHAVHDEAHRAVSLRASARYHRTRS